MSVVDPAPRRDGIPKLQMEGNDDETCMTFLIEKEDHTLGNALRYVMAKSLDVEFCGYSVPHPTEHRMNIRVQTTGMPATQALRTSLRTLITMTDHLKSVYNSALEQHEFSR